MRFPVTALLLAAAAAASLSTGFERPAPRRIDVAEGVSVFLTAPYGDVGLDGNAIAVISPEGVLVFDSNGTPAASAAVLAAIRKLTPQPIKYVVNSHWHWDHWYGTETYTDAFPDVRVVAQERTRTLMMGPALAFNRPGLERDLPHYVDSLAQKAARNEAATPPPADLAATKQRLDEDRFFLEQKTRVRHVFPNLTYDSALTIHLGGREIRILNFGRAVTPGDTLMYLPAEKVVVTGDLLVNPISFALSCYPTEWLRALERVDGLDAAVIVPGHGEPLRDKTLLHATMAVFRELLDKGAAAKRRGLDPDRARDEILPLLEPLQRQITHGDPTLAGAFKMQLVDWYLHRVWNEMDGPLTDAIAPIPTS